MEKKILTNSALTAFKICPKKYELQYVRGYVPAKDSEALYFGKLMHAGLEAWGKKARQLQAAYDAVYDLAQGGKTDEFTYYKALALLEGYHNLYQNEPFEIVSPEQQFRAPILNPETMRESTLFDMMGIMDCVIKRKGTDRIMIKETKTTGDSIENPASDYWRKLSMDPQVSAYYIGAEALGHKVDGCLYDVIKKPGISPYKATPADKRQYKKDGTLYASQREKDESPEEYYERLKADIAERPTFYYARKEVPRSQNDLAEYMDDTWQAAQSIRFFENKGKFPRYTNACVGVFGRCKYFEVCAGAATLDDPGLFRKEENPHQELKLGETV